MNLGLGNLDDLKDYVMHPSVQGTEAFDALLQALGRGVADAFDRQCNRRFERSATAQDEFTADRSYWILRNFPFESIAQIDRKDDEATGWQTLTTNDAIINRAEKTGRIEFGSRLGSHLSQVRVSYTGGYWFETLEPSDVGYPSAMPGAATLLPSDVKLAWQMQVNFLFRKRDALNLQRVAADNPEAAAVLQSISSQALLPEVQRILDRHIRFA